METELRVEGLPELRKALRRVDQRTSLKVIRAATRFAVKPTIDKAVLGVPKGEAEDQDGYSLSRFIRLRAEKKRDRTSAVQFRLGPQRSTRLEADPPGYAIAGGLSRKATAPNYAQLIEKDTPFLMPAYLATRDQVLRRFADKLRQSVEKL